MTSPGSASAPSVPALVEPGPPLTAAQRERWSRHLLLPQLGESAQRRLRNARVCVVGAGGLGAPVLLYLAAAGVGRLGVVDDDVVEASNLQRQVLHGVADVGRPKVDSAADAVRALDPDVEVVTHRLRLEAGTVDLLADYDLVVDGTDNFPTRYLVNDACVRLGVPEVWGSVFRFDAQVAVFWGSPPAGSGVTPVQLRDLFPSPPPPGSVPSCAEGGVLGAMCGQVGSVMATEAVKLLTGVGRPLLGRVLVMDALAARWTEVPLVAAARPPGTPAHAGAPPERAAPEPVVPVVTARELADRLTARDDGGPGLQLVDVRQPGERAIVAIPGADAVPLAGILDGSGRGLVRRDVPVVLHCRSGVRSEQAARALLAAGWSDVAHLEGGVLAWVDQVDPSQARY
ncbi:ThiF family adenylyltransferase [Actinotalea sp. Marseille-Q4924]|uniref:ThiF family adenylyltransferase n=1 Tax=Actinotalea sp. Marseille-Q4924 TaxID=2866571 RepID=UPI001CE3FC74|nr:ThiF family adenylyltransferase [Actinotalea sp. Marseille-Q4924]